MKLTLAEPRYLKDSIAIISELVNEGNFKVSQDGVELVAMDPANVAMVVFKLLASCFADYQVSEETTLAINLSNLKQVLRRSKPNDTITLEQTEENKLKITLQGKSKRTFSLPIIDLEDKEHKVPDLQFPVSVKTTADTLSDAIEDVDIVGESVSFEVAEKQFTVSAEGDLSKARIDIPEDDKTNVINESGGSVKAKYSIEYLKKMVGGGKLADSVMIRFNKDYPAKLEFTSVDKVSLAFILAPRVEND